MLKVEMRPMVSVRQAAHEIAVWLRVEDKESIVFEDICSCLTDTDSQIVAAYLPEDEDELVLNYDIECEKFFRMVKDATGLLWGGKFLANLE